MRPDDVSFLRPGLWAGLAAAAGAVTGLFLVPTAFSYAAGLALLAAGSVFGWRLASPALRRVCLVVAFAAAGFLAALLAPRPPAVPELAQAAENGRPVRFTGRLVEAPNRRLDPPRWRATALQPRMTVLVDVDHVFAENAWKPASARLLLGGEDVPLDAYAGDAVEGTARLVPMAGPLNPGEPDARVRLQIKGISYAGALERGSLAATGTGGGFDRGAQRFREEFSGFVQKRVGDGDRAALVAALSVGERGSVSPDLSQAFNASGLAHVLSISGLHLAVAVLALAWLLRRIFGLSGWLSARIAPRRLAALVALPISAFYVALIGAPAPAVRAGLGTGLLLLGRAAGRETDALNTLGWSLGLVAVLDPAALVEPSTLLSFLGVFGLAYLAPRLRELVPVAPPVPQTPGIAGVFGRLRENLLVGLLGSLAATIATAPVTAAYFERTSLVAALANLVAWPASTLIVPSGALAAAVFPVSPTLAGPLVDLAGICALLLAWCARFFASWPLAAVTVPPPTPGVFVAYAALVAGLANLRRWPWKLSLGIAVPAAAMLAILAIPQGKSDGRMEVTFLGVGQGDATFVRFPQGSTMLVDAGGEASMRFDPGARVVAPFLRFEGVSRLDVVVASHPHPDHIAGLPSVFQRFAIGELWHDGLGIDEGPQADLLAAAREAGARVVDFRQGLPAACPGLAPLDEANPVVASLAVGDPRCRAAPPERTIDGVRVEVLHPLNGPEKAAFPELGENDNSLVLRLTHGDVHVLLPGDLEKEGEALLLASGRDLSADVLKAPHHGSRTSSTEAFIRAVQPKHVVFCVGAHNPFGFPKAEVVDRYAAANCTRWRTDAGAVTFVSDGHTVEARPFRTGP